ncbi:hypothetical protein ACQKIE_04735 [Luteibacter sp. NPDC031894]|uniref:hypothetical protein n=1 Tax=Luteibacter sp. NPDC031894 TaxID=3390572 RepID=UPI003CFF5809
MMSESPTRPALTRLIKRHFLLANAVITATVSVLAWFASGQASVVALASAREQVNGLTTNAAGLRADRAEDRVDLDRLRTAEADLRESYASCQQARVTLTAQVQPLPELKSQLADAQRQVAQLTSDAALARMAGGLLRDETALNEQIRNHMTMASFNAEHPTDGSDDPVARQLIVQRQDLTAHINILLGVRPDVLSPAPGRGAAARVPVNESTPDVF